MPLHWPYDIYFKKLLNIFMVFVLVLNLNYSLLRNFEIDKKNRIFILNIHMYLIINKTDILDFFLFFKKSLFRHFTSTR